MKLNISKCKELIIDFAKDKQEFSPLIINGVAVDRVSSARALGLIVQDNMNWNEHARKQCCQKSRKKTLHAESA